MKRWAMRIVVGLMAAFIIIYFGDWAVFRLRGSPHASVPVNQYLNVPLKGNKQEYDYQGTVDVPCSISLFSQGGQSACWQVRRNKNQWTNL